MFIARNTGKEKQIGNLIKQYLQNNNDQRPKGIHVSDLKHPLRSYFDKLYPVDTELNEDQIGYFFAGESFEILFSKVISPIAGIAHSQPGVWNDIHFEMDFIDQRYNPQTVSKFVSVEVKSTRQTHVYKNELPDGPKLIDECSTNDLAIVLEEYLKQLKMYMVICGSNVGELIVFYYYMTIAYKNNIAMGTKKPRLRIFNVSINNEELLAEANNMIKTRDSYIHALQTQQPHLLEPCPEWMCRNCEHYNKNCQGAIAIKQQTGDPLEL